MKTLFSIMVGIVFLVGGLATTYGASGVDGLERVVQELVKPPFLPKHSQVAKGEPKVVQVRLVIKEMEIKLLTGFLCRP